MSIDTTTTAISLSPLSPSLSPIAVMFVPARPLSPHATEPVFKITPTTERVLSLSPEARDFVPAFKRSDSPLSPHAAVYDPREPTPAREVLPIPAPLPTRRLLLALLDRYCRNVLNGILHLERLEALPTYIGRTHGLHLMMEGMVAYEDWDLWYDAVKLSCRTWVARHRAVKARFDAGLWLDVEEDEDEESLFGFSEYQPVTFTFHR